MTRINLIEPHLLSGKHLVAEYRELPRIYGTAVTVDRLGTYRQIPGTYRMGAGHMRFFADKLTFIRDRHRALIAQMRVRGYAPKFDGSVPTPAIFLPPEFWKDYHPDAEAYQVSLDRLKEKDPEFYFNHQNPFTKSPV